MTRAAANASAEWRAAWRHAAAPRFRRRPVPPRRPIPAVGRPPEMRGRGRSVTTLAGCASSWPAGSRGELSVPLGDAASRSTARNVSRARAPRSPDGSPRDRRTRKARPDASCRADGADQAPPFEISEVIVAQRRIQAANRRAWCRARRLGSEQRPCRGRRAGRTRPRTSRRTRPGYRAFQLHASATRRSSGVQPLARVERLRRLARPASSSRASPPPRRVRADARRAPSPRVGLMRDSVPTNTTTCPASGGVSVMDEESIGGTHFSLEMRVRPQRTCLCQSFLH